jgi:hypothetical protein
LRGFVRNVCDAVGAAPTSAPKRSTTNAPPNAVYSGPRRPRTAAILAGSQARRCYRAAMVCPDEDRSPERDSRCIGLAGGSPVAVSAVAPRSRLQVSREIAASERSVKGSLVGVCRRSGVQSRRPNIK